ncbi:MAG TPA: hypothetical protein VNL18_15400, partial [Gemmatimonadales bacterium]|nr:hypothetical protein [Gemmatimonadales bacterium]
LLVDPPSGSELRIHCEGHGRGYVELGPWWGDATADASAAAVAAAHAAANANAIAGAIAHAFAAACASAFAPAPAYANASAVASAGDFKVLPIAGGGTSKGGHVTDVVSQAELTVTEFVALVMRCVREHEVSVPEAVARIWDAYHEQLSLAAVVELARGGADILLYHALSPSPTPPPAPPPSPTPSPPPSPSPSPTPTPSPSPTPSPERSPPHSGPKMRI